MNPLVEVPQQNGWFEYQLASNGSMPVADHNDPHGLVYIPLYFPMNGPSWPMLEMKPRNDAMHIPRPPNSFILFRKDSHHQYRARYPDISNGALSKLIAKAWRVLPTQEKSAYQKKAMEVRRLHQKLYPQWRYAPKRRASDGDILPGTEGRVSEREQPHYEPRRAASDPAVCFEAMMDLAPSDIGFDFEQSASTSESVAQATSNDTEWTRCNIATPDLFEGVCFERLQHI